MGTTCQGGTRRLTDRDPRVALLTYVTPHPPSRIARGATRQPILLSGEVRHA